LKLNPEIPENPNPIIDHQGVQARANNGEVCCRCKTQSFNVAVEPTDQWRMGLLRQLAVLPKKFIRESRLTEWVKADNPKIRFLCGNCFFDLTD